MALFWINNLVEIHGNRHVSLKLLCLPEQSIFRRVC